MAKFTFTIPIEDMTREQFEKELISMIGKLKQSTILKVNALEKKYTNSAKKQFRELVTTSVKAYYSDYTPRSYQRKYSFYDAFNVDVTNDHWNIDMDPYVYYANNSVHGSLTNYIFEYMFTEGYHGGVLTDESPDVPYFVYREHDVWVHEPAPQTIPSPYQLIMDGAQKINDELLQGYESELNDRLSSDVEEIIGHINKYMGVK